MAGIQVTVAGHAIETLKLSELTYDEWFEVEERTKWGLFDMDRAMKALSPKAWFVLLYLSIKRRVPDFDESELKNSNFAETMAEIMAAITAANEEAEELPPADASATSDAPKPSSGDNGSSTAPSESLTPETTPVDDGSLTSS